jgi:hypothetical protein
MLGGCVSASYRLSWSLGCAEWSQLGPVMVQIAQDEKQIALPAKGQVLHLPIKQVLAHGVDSVFNPTDDASAPQELVQAYERFQLQVQLDIENERELLYKSLLVVEVLVFLFVLRELMIRWLA